LYVYYENFNHFQTKIYQTKPIFEKAKMIITNYKPKNYVNISRLSATEKQSQTNPIQTQFFICHRDSKAKTNPNFYSNKPYSFSVCRRTEPLTVPYYSCYQIVHCRLKKKFKTADFCSVFVRVFDLTLPIEEFTMSEFLKMDNHPEKQIEPVCRFGPGGDFVSNWPPQNKRPAKLLSRLNEIITSLIGSTSKENLEYVVETNAGKSAGGRDFAIGEPSYSSPTAAIKSNSRFSGRPLLFPDDCRTGSAADNKQKHHIRAYRRAAKKRPLIVFAGRGSLFEADLQSAKTA
jgi:hypothetical protein